MYTFQKYIKKYSKDHYGRDILNNEWKQLIEILPPNVRPTFTISKGYVDSMPTHGIRMTLKLPDNPNPLVIQRSPRGLSELSLVTQSLADLRHMYLYHKEKETKSQNATISSDTIDVIDNEIIEKPKETIGKPNETIEKPKETIENPDNDDADELEALLEAQSKGMQQQIKVSNKKKALEEKRKKQEEPKNFENLMKNDKKCSNLFPQMIFMVLLRLYGQTHPPKKCL